MWVTVTDLSDQHVFRTIVITMLMFYCPQLFDYSAENKMGVDSYKIKMCMRGNQR